MVRGMARGMAMTSPAQVDSWKLQAAEQALAAVEEGMLLGLGSGTTAARFVDLLGERVRHGLNVTCVPTSESTRAQAERLGIALTTLEDVPFLDLTVDGADELDSHLRLIKGGGGALLREKIVAVASERMLVIADASKHVDTLGNFPLPVEVVRFGLAATRNLLGAVAADAGCSGEIRLRLGRDGEPFVTDSGNVLFDCVFGRIDNPEALDLALKSVPGVVENGLFLGIADAAIIAGADGVSVINRDTVTRAP